MKNIFNLTNREIEVINLYNKGKTAKEIGQELKVSSRTIEVHARNFKSKLNDSKNMASALRIARQYKIVED
jgi:DNA-binding NarL/FixJ family response regulator